MAKIIFTYADGGYQNDIEFDQDTDINNYWEDRS